MKIGGHCNREKGQLMGRHGTGGSDDGDELGNGSAFWGPDEQAEPPGWPSLPDQPEVTGEWAPMPRHTDGPPPRAPQSEPFETTGAFALPNDSAGGFPPANDPGAAFPPHRGDAGPFETTGAFARPPEWSSPSGPSDPPNGFFDAPGTGDEPGFFGGPETFDGRAPFNGPPDQYNGPADQTAVFNARPGRPGPGAQGPGQPGFFGGPPSGPPSGPFDRPGPFGGPDDRLFDGPGDRPGPFDADRPFGSFEEGPADRTARFDSPSGPVFGGPPEPGDIKVAGEPTAVQAPAWADAETGFLGSGWSNDEPEEPGERRSRRKSGRGGGGGGGDVLAAPSGAGKGRVALLSVAAVAVVLGGTVAGVKFMSSPGGTCEGATCAAVQATSSQPGPAISEPAEEESPEEEPSGTEEESTPSKTPTPTASYSARTPRRTASPTPTPTKTKVKKAPAEDPAEDPPVEDTVSESPSEEVSSLGSDTEVAVPDGATPAPTETGPFGSTSSGGGVNVQQTIQQRLTTYKAELTVSNSSAQTLQNPTVSVPVDGKVVNVDGAEWTQDGDLLILDVSTSLAAGTSIDVSFTATGRGSKAQTCGMVAGECAVT